MAKKRNSHYEVGYGKPPEEHKFQRGKPSKNPKGRKKGSKNFAILVQKGLQEKVVIIKNGTKKKMTAQEVIVQSLITNAMKGSDKAIERVFKLFPEQSMEAHAKHVERLMEAELMTYSDEELTDFIRAVKGVGEAMREEEEAKVKEKK